jgi:hypothetical protein
MVIILKFSSLLPRFGSKFRGFWGYLQSGDKMAKWDEKGHRIGHHFMVIKSCTYWKNCPCFYFWDSLEQNDNGNHFEIKYQKVGVLHTKRRQDCFCEDSNGHKLSRCCTISSTNDVCTRCAHVLDMLEFFGNLV